jgi:hypothetical protein
MVDDRIDNALWKSKWLKHELAVLGYLETKAKEEEAEKQQTKAKEEEAEQQERDAMQEWDKQQQEKPKGPFTAGVSLRHELAVKPPARVTYEALGGFTWGRTTESRDPLDDTSNQRLLMQTLQELDQAHTSADPQRQSAVAPWICPGRQFGMRKISIHVRYESQGGVL